MNFDVNAYTFIIFLSGVIILAFIYNIISKKLRVPSVLLLIGTGMLLGELNRKYQFISDDLISPVLEVLGIMGLMIIVLEAALDLELKRDKLGMIIRSFSIAFILVAATSLATAYVIQLFLDISLEIAIVYAIPLCIVSSAITIPSVSQLPEAKKEFMIYESTFSDIIGIIMFYFMIDVVEVGDWGHVIKATAIENLLTIVASVGISYVMILFIQRIGRGINYYLILAILLLLFAFGKLVHLSSLVMILIFGLVINNHKLFFPGFMQRFIKHGTYKAILLNLKGFTAQTSFLVRTFFFLIFGMSISIAVFGRLEYYSITLLILLVLYILRAISLGIFFRTRLLPELFIAPRGLITILLFYSMPENLKVEGFEQDLVLMLILSTNIIMMMALIFTKTKEDLPGEIEEINASV
jgi:NhaP-type Na+/H+ or K+/H+ antiporter